MVNLFVDSQKGRELTKYNEIMYVCIYVDMDVCVCIFFSIGSLITERL